MKRDAEQNDRPGGMIGAADLARIFPGLTMSAANRLMRRRGFPNIKIGRHRYTSDEWLAGWMAAQLENPPPVKNWDPLEAALVERLKWAVGELVVAGKICVLRDLPVGDVEKSGGGPKGPVVAPASCLQLPQAG